MSSDSEDLEVDFLNYHPNQPHEVLAKIPQEPIPPVKAPVEEQQEQEPHIDAPIEELHHLTNEKQETQENHKIQVTLIQYLHSHPY